MGWDGGVGLGSTVGKGDAWLGGDGGAVCRGGSDVIEVATLTGFWLLRLG